MRRLLPTLSLLALLLLAAPALADNVDLVTVPGRDGVQLTIYNSEDLTLVKERRHVTMKKGPNRLLFSWANTLIDPTSVELRPLAHANEVEIVDTVFPGQKPQFLAWNIDSTFEGQLPVEVTYFTSGLTWAMDYVGICDADEEHMDFRGYVRVFNRSGEAYENAEIRLIVGTVNLVEKIADLARRQGIPHPEPGSPVADRLRREGAKQAFGLAEAARDMPATRGKAIVKEGLSEYFMFSVEGEETVENGWSKRMKAVDTEDEPFDILYRMRAHQYGPRPVRFFLWNNDREHGLGDSPLPDGRIRLFRENGRDGLSFLGEQQVRYVPVKGRIEVNVGADDLVVYEAVRSSTERLAFRFDHGRVVGWDERTHWVDTVRNYRDEPIVFELHRQWPGDIELSSEMKTALFDYRTAEIRFAVAARDTRGYPCTILQHHGRNAGQSRIRLR